MPTRPRRPEPPNVRDHHRARSPDRRHPRDRRSGRRFRPGRASPLPSLPRGAGVEVTLVERFGCFGGNITAVGVEGHGVVPARSRRSRRTASVASSRRGRTRWARRFRRASHCRSSSTPRASSSSPTRLVEEAGIRGMLHRTFAAPIMDGDTITGIITESKAGREAILAARVIDATGDADVAHRAGAPTFHTPKEQMMAASVMFHLAGVDKKAFIEGVKADPQTYKDWAGGGEWNIETGGKEDDMFSPFLKRPFEQAIKDGLLPPTLSTLAGTWGAIHETGELTYMNLVHMDGDRRHRPRRSDAWRDRGPPAGDARDRGLPPLHARLQGARLRNFGMTLGIRDTRKIDAVYNMTEQRRPRSGRGSTTRSGSTRSSSTATAS